MLSLLVERTAECFERFGINALQHSKRKQRHVHQRAN
jgi:hypothetical protein